MGDVGQALVIIGAMALLAAVLGGSVSAVGRRAAWRGLVAGLVCVSAGVAFSIAAVGNATSVVTGTALVLWTFLALPLVGVAWWRRRISRRAAMFGAAAWLTLPYLGSVVSIMARGASDELPVWAGIGVVMFVVTAAGADLVARAFEDDRPGAAREDDRPGSSPGA